MNCDIVVIGVGNGLRGDDAVGLAVIDALEAAGCVARLVRSDGNPTALLTAWEDAGWAILVDAAAAGAPGQVAEWEAGAEPLPTGVFPSTHLVGPGEAIELARVLGRLPERLTVVGIPGERFTVGAPMSAAVEAAVAAVAADLGRRIPEAAHA